MSIYSGFATRIQEETYDQLVEDLLFVLQKRIIKFYNKEPADEFKFFEVLRHLHHQMAKMEEHKYLQPKTSKSFEDIMRFLQTNGIGTQPTNENPESANHFLTPYKESGTAPLRTAKRMKSHKDSLSHINESATVGKIIHQIPKVIGEESSLADSRNTFWNPETHRKQQPHANADIFGDHFEDKKKQSRPQINKSREHSTNSKASKNNLKGVKYYSNDKLVNKEKERSGDILAEYFEKNSKNYLRGYRKRQVKTRQFSNQI